MDVMVDIIKAYAGNNASAAQIAEYIATGKGKEEVFKLLPQAKKVPIMQHMYSVERLMDVFQRDMTTAELPRLYNMLTLLIHMKNSAHFANMLISHGMGDMLLAAFKDENELLDLLLHVASEIVDANAAFQNRQALIRNFSEAVYAHNPAIFEALLSKIPPAATYAKDLSYLLRFYMLHKDYARYKAIQPALIQDAKRTAEKFLTHKEVQAARREGLSLFGSFIAYGKAGEIRDIINDVYIKASFIFLECLNRHSCSIIRDKFEELGIDLAPFFAFSAQSDWNTYNIINNLNDFFGDRYDDLNRALAYTNIQGKGLIYFYLHEKAQPVDMAAWEQTLNQIPPNLACRFAGSMLGQSAVAISYVANLLSQKDMWLNVQAVFEFVNKKYINDLLNKLDNEKLLLALSTTRKYNNTLNQLWDYVLTAIAQKDPNLYKKTFAALEGDPHIYLATCLPKDFDIDFYIDLLGDKSKKVSNIAFDVLKDRPDLKPKIATLVESKKKAIREYAEKLLMAYDGGSAEGKTVDIAEYFKKYGKNIEKALEWTNPKNWPKVRGSDDITLKYYVYQFLNSKTMDMPPHVQNIAKAFNKEDLHALAADIYSQWLAAGGEAKKKGALLLFGVNANNNDVSMLYKQIVDWADHSRGAIAAEAVKAMALSGQELALMQVDSIAAKFKNKQVRKAATESFALAASAMGLSSEQLADRIIPDLGFNQAGEKLIDYGTRKFTAFLTPALAVELKDEAGKAIKSLPKPGAKDDEAKATAAKAEFTVLKKSLKTVVGTQAMRLENALSSGRSWSIDAWAALFVKNPIMHSFAMGLIWGFYKSDTLAKTFRYMSDGSLADENDDALEFTDYKEHVISLVHPLELSAELIAAWKEQLDDYEIAQPFLQLYRPTYSLADDEKDSKFFERFGGVTLPAITLINKLIKMGWSKGSVQDGGCFSDTYKEFPESKIGVQLNHSYAYVGLGWDGNDDMMMGQVAFYKDEVARGSYVYDEPSNFIMLKDVPAKLFSEVVYNLTEASKTSTIKNDKWKNNNDISMFS